MQIRNINKNHWIALSTVGCQIACVKKFDSGGGKELPKSTLMLISDLLQTPEIFFFLLSLLMFRCRNDHVTVDYLLWPLSLSFVMDKIQLFYHIKQNAMRKHILKSIEDGVMTAFPSSASRHPKAVFSDISTIALK